jgi:hypothetical protein
VALGYPKTKDSIDGMLGDIAQSMNRSFRRAVQLGTELSSYTDAQLTGAGYTTAEVATLRAMVTDLNQLNGIYTGAANLATAKDFRANLRPMWGVLGDH